MRNRKLALAGILLLAMIGGGCGGKTVVTNLPPGVTNAEVNNWTTSVHYLKNISDITHAAQTAVIMSNRNGIFKDGDAYAATVTAIGRADALELQADAFLKTVPNQFGQPVQEKLMAFTQQILTQLNLASSQVGVPANIVTQIATAINLGLQIEQLIQTLTACNFKLPETKSGIVTVYPIYEITINANSSCLVNTFVAEAR